MRDKRKPRETSRILQSMKRLPLFHRTLIIMLCMVLLMLLGIYLSGRIFRNSLTENYLQLAENKLEQSSNTLGSTIHNIYAIPQAIEDNRYFSYLRTERSGTLPRKYLPILTEMQNALSNQMFLQGNNIECLLYFSGSNSLVSRNNVYRYAEDCFVSYIQISEEEQIRLLECMKTPDTQKLIPLQDVTIGYTHYGFCWAYVVRIRGTSTAVATIYPASYVIDFFDLASLPAETLLTIDSLEGEQLLAYPAAPENYNTSAYHLVSTHNNLLRHKVTLHIPNSYFKEQMQQVTQSSLLITILVVIAAIAFSFFMSRMSSKPLQNLLESHGHQRPILRGEEEILDQILTQNKQVQQVLHETLSANLLSKLFSGAILSGAEMQQFSHYTESMPWPWQAAVVYVNESANLLQIRSYIQKVLGENAFCQSINPSQVGVLMSGDLDNTALLEDAVETLQKEYPQIDIRCGVSDSIDQPEQLHVGVQHAKMALPRDYCFEVYSSNDSASKASLSWIQHERLYQSILNDDQLNAMDILQQIATEPYRDTAARETYYSILFILRNAASTLNITLEELHTLHYATDLPPWENIGQLEVYLKLLFERVQAEKDRKQHTMKRRVVDYVDRNFSDCNLCAASVANVFALSDKQIYRIIREVTGMSLNEYLLVIRMRKAGELLRASTLSPGEIAIQCGYPAESTFYRVFKGYYGMAPGKYRQNQ